MFSRVIVLVLLALFIWGYVARESSASGKSRTYVVRPGDTLWALAQRYYAGDPRQAVWKLERVNGLASASIVPGQRLSVPARPR
jgi:LysM repeat protein